MDTLQMMVWIALAAGVGGYALVRLILAARAEPRKRKDPAPPDRLAPDLAAAVPSLADTRDELQKMLWTAGYYRPSALTEYLAIRAVLFIGLLIGTGLVCFLVEPARIPVVAFF